MKLNRRRMIRELLSVTTILLTVATWLPASDNALEKKFEARKRTAMKELERRLTTRNGAGDADTWYVLAFHDQAAQAEFRRFNPTERSGYWNYDVKRNTSTKKVRGRTAAAEAVYQFLVRSSESMSDLPPSAFDHMTRWEKAWDYRSFRSAKEAEAFYLNHR